MAPSTPTTTTTTTTTTALAAAGKVEKKFGNALRKDFLFGDGFTNLNHGSFGTYPRPVREALRKYQDASEARPDEFVFYTYAKILDESRAAMAKLLSVPMETLVFVPNATTGVNTVLRNLVFQQGDHILYTGAIYGACEKTVVHLTETTPVEGVKIEFDYPVEDDWIVDQVREKVAEVERKGGRVKVMVLDTVVSIPGVRMPFERIVSTCRELGVLSCVDGAHGVGHVDLDLPSLDPDFLVSNCHKWLFVPRGCAIFHVPLRNQHLIRTTLPTSHGFIPQPKQGVAAKIFTPIPSSGPKSSFVRNFEFMATIDNSPFLCIPAALAYRQSIGGEEAIMAYTTALAKKAGRIAAQAFGTQVLENDAGTLGACSMTNVRLPLSPPLVQSLVSRSAWASSLHADLTAEEVGVLVREWMSKVLLDDHQTFCMIKWYAGAWWVRFSAQVYLEESDFVWGAQVAHPKSFIFGIKEGQPISSLCKKRNTMIQTSKTFRITHQEENPCELSSFHSEFLAAPGRVLAQPSPGTL
ncbi:PLP-dependent transferase [Pleomassaria siparia CBS 279.74]|uniref:PLP-dependent transferase n=1 Tax=Pleomassaria siparia CBS 279.74 TaxID=1314801 RepID=A0A6G1KL85_9PLEO|nr:PLP-dependent transferase [Pleomassaria siparia CBS 279.74]